MPVEFTADENATLPNTTQLETADVPGVGKRSVVKAHPSKGLALASSVAVNTTADLLLAADPLRVNAILHNIGPEIVYLGGGSGVTALTGFPLAPGEMLTDNNSDDDWYGITASGSSDVRVSYVNTSSGLVSPTGGTITQVAGYCIHTFSASGDTFDPQDYTSLEYDVMILAGGGPGGGGSGVGGNGGGGGAGGMIVAPGIAITTPQAVTIGTGGLRHPTSNPPSLGGNTVFGSLYTAIGGGRGGDNNNAPSTGGSAGGNNRSSAAAGVAGTSGQGNAGGSGYGAGTSGAGGGGGGGKSGPGQSVVGSAGVGGNGGPGLMSYYSGAGLFYAGGGGGGVNTNGGDGGSEVGGAGGQDSHPAGFYAVAGRGSGGGGGRNGDPGGNGSDGVVIVRYPCGPSYTPLFEAYDAAVMAASPEAYWPMWSDPEEATVAEAMVGSDGAYVNSPHVNSIIDGIPHVVTMDGVSSHATCPFPATNIVREIVCPVYLSSVTVGNESFLSDATAPAAGAFEGTFMAGIANSSAGNPGGWWARARGRDMDSNAIEATTGWHFHSLYVRTTTGNSEYRIDNGYGQGNGSSNLHAWNSPFYLGKSHQSPEYRPGSCFGFAIFGAYLTVPQRTAIYDAFAAILAGP